MNDLTFETLPEIIREQAQRIEILEKSLIELKAKQKQDEFMTIDEYCAHYKRAKSSVYIEVSQNKIPFFKVGKRLYFKKSEIEKYNKEKSK